MARPLRTEFPGAVYHVTSRGNAPQAIFLDQDDRESFLGGSILSGGEVQLVIPCLLHYGKSLSLIGRDSGGKPILGNEAATWGLYPGF
jgi:hypothetical protein